ncbi:MAG: DUF721 domain-containing protein [Desulfobacterales bacterium]
MTSNKRQPTPIGNVVKDILLQCHSGSAINMESIVALWPHVVEMDVAANTLPAAFRQQLLLVNVSSSVWIQELRFKKEDIIRKLNDAVGKSVVSEITFKVGPIR